MSYRIIWKTTFIESEEQVELGGFDTPRCRHHAEPLDGLGGRVLFEREARKAQREVRRSVKAGTEYEGKVTSLTDYGAFVDIGGGEGLVHVSELSTKKIRSPDEVVRVGDQVQVTVLKVEPDDRKIGLSLIAHEDPGAAPARAPVAEETPAEEPPAAEAPAEETPAPVEEEAPAEEEDKTDA